MKLRKISVVTGTRAEYGLLYWIIKGIHDDVELELQLIVTGMHLSHEFGLTVREIENDGFPISDRVEMLISSDTETSIAISMGLGIIGFAKAYERLKPDILVILGDRFEVLSAASAAIPFRVPIAHIHGGESTEGVIDESIRHAITKMSHIHFTSNEIYRNRVIQMGELPDSVFCFGSLGVDNINRMNLMDKKELALDIGIPLDKKWGIVTYHPVTLEKHVSETQITELIKAVKRFDNIYWIFTFPNADTEGRIIIDKIKDFTTNFAKNGKFFTSLGQLRYCSLMRNASIMLGNSSSGLTESPSFDLPVVNIGDRQKGRVRGENVIDVTECTEAIIVNAISQALSNDFSIYIKKMKNPHRERDVSERIVHKIKTIPINDNILKKKFYDVLY